MSRISLASNASGTGTLTIAAPDTNSDRTLTLPDSTTTLVGTDATQTLTNKTIQGGTITSATAVSASGTSIDFTGIPSWVKRITVTLKEVSTNAGGNYQFQLGTSGGIQTTGYVCFGSYNGASNAGYTSTAGFILFNDTATDVYTGQLILTLQDAATGTWVATGAFGMSRWYTMFTNGAKTLSGTLDRVRITTAAGTPAFDAGTINIMYEG